jgi:hypothetical protein
MSDHSGRSHDGDDATAPSSSPAEQIQALDHRLSVAEATVDMTAHAVARGDRGEAVARFTIATIVVLTYALAVGAFFVVLLTDALRNNRYDAFYTNAFEFMKIAVIPIVTYVLGYYSARSSR